mmetsp:Transcript_6424/g.9516  ORF Transcript_6424/g.9516 Transcript_6424/m.9516 type:complete len:448 (+) Transcript_6424:50-1393(+)
MPDRQGDAKQSATLISDLRVANAELSDINLKCADGINVATSRFILAARSRVFRRMLYGNFAESKSNEVPVMFPSTVVRPLVNYCISDEVVTTRTNFAQYHFNGGEEEEAAVLCGIVNAAHYFELPGLEQIAADHLCTRMDERPPVACVVLEETSTATTVEGMGKGDMLGVRFQRLTWNLRKRAMDVIRHRTRDALLPHDLSHGRGVLSLSASGIWEVISDSDIHADELMLFQCLKKWVDEYDGADCGGTTLRGAVAAAPQKRKHDEMADDRLSVAQALSSKIDLTKIPPSALKNIVSPSGLIGKEDLASAFEAQALRAENHGFSFSRVRSTSEPKGKVVVKGAGVQEVNGEYVPRGRIDGVTKYVKISFWKGREEAFSLFRFASIDGSRTWYISIVPRNFEPGSDDDRDFYFFQCQYDFPFGRDWKAKEEGVDPAPICVWEPDNEWS